MHLPHVPRAVEVVHCHKTALGAVGESPHTPQWRTNAPGFGCVGPLKTVRERLGNALEKVGERRLGVADAATGLVEQLDGYFDISLWQ